MNQPTCSKNEARLFQHFGVDIREGEPCRPRYLLYSDVALRQFARPIFFSTPAVDALRRGFIHLFYENNNPGTPEYEELIAW